MSSQKSGNMISGDSHDSARSTSSSNNSPPGLPHDSELPIRMIFASRMEQLSNEPSQRPHCESIHGQAYVDLMKVVFGEASAVLLGPQVQISTTTLKTIFDAPGTTLSDPKLYTRLSDIAEQMPFETAKAVYKTMLDEIEAYRDTAARDPRRAMGMPAFVLLNTCRRLNLEDSAKRVGPTRAHPACS